MEANMYLKTRLAVALVCVVTITCSEAKENAMAKINAQLRSAIVRNEDGLLVVSTGIIERRWKWTGKGLLTVGLRDLRRSREWAAMEPAKECDWSLPSSYPKESAVLEGLVAEESSDDGFTSDHLSVTATVAYPAANLKLKYVIWVYPNAPGIRTQLFVSGDPSIAYTGEVVDYAPVRAEGLRRRAIGYYNDTQNRHTSETPLIREEIVTASKIDWASILCLEDAQSGMAMVKESHKCVNQPGVYTGDFSIDAHGLSNTGTGFEAKHLRKHRDLACWATWVIVYGAGDCERELAIKQFARLRFPIQLSRDMYIKADTWGSGNSGRESRDKGTEVEVLKEIDSVSDLGLDGLQIDDGWQQSKKADGWKPDGSIGWRPHPEAYPEGWKRVRDRAEAKGIKLGLWTVAESISLDEMKWNYDQAGFWTWKLDFAHFSNPARIKRNISKVRSFLLYTEHNAQMAWDVTEIAPRYGYFWALEYGCVWLSNRKPNFPESTIPKPWLMLRENWELARYVNINKFQLPIQNFQMVNREQSDAYKHSHSYEVALGLAGTPVFFQTTYYYQGKARDEIRDLVARYKAHREEMFTSYVLPIGDEPSNASWSGFQWYHPERDSGYLMIFRELNNQDKEKRVALRFISDTTIRLLDIRTGKERSIKLNGSGEGLFSIETPADFLFCRYEKLKD
jgi:hypothetical protein